MSLDVRAVASDTAGPRWTVGDDPHGCFVRDGRASSDRDGAERTAQAAAATMEAGPATSVDRITIGGPPVLAPSTFGTLTTATDFGISTSDTSASSFTSSGPYLSAAPSTTSAKTGSGASSAFGTCAG